MNHSLENKMGNIVLGWNKGRRQEINLGSKATQTFVQIPTPRLKDRISQLCERHGIRFIETQESSTSKASFSTSDELPTFGAKPEGWKESRRRVKRGLYCLKDGFKINADCNGAAKILPKVSATLGLFIEGVSRGALISTSEGSYLASSRIPLYERTRELQ
ncbi:zinc ribbon domain-containing protein [Microcoleus sp. herbarium2]|uniref:zinc ribbon domain-containing protein n=1 Tax=Microcoleus sp. herbarium2 TaxID=3055433 RepID=UPI002FD24D89